MEQIRISVALASYNGEKYIASQLESILQNLSEQDEIVVSDDGSTDSSGIICDEYVRKDTRIKVIHKENGGLSSARNVALDIATGEYLSFIDDLQASNYIIAFSKSALLANLRKAEHILETKNDIDRYFTNK